MGMAAGQARLLSITARLSDNEQNGQALSFAKQRLADEADQVNREYNEALNATKLTVLTGFNGADAQYTDISYGLLTEYNKLAAGKQYLVTNQKGQILVTEDIKNAYKAGNGDFNKFINYFGLSQNDVDFAKLTDTDLDEQTGIPKKYQVVHDAWDKYLTSVGLGFPTAEHDLQNADDFYPDVIFGWRSTYIDENGDEQILARQDQNPYVKTQFVHADNFSTATFKNEQIVDGEKVPVIQDLPLGAIYQMSQPRNIDGSLLTLDGVPRYCFSAFDKDGKGHTYWVEQDRTGVLGSPYTNIYVAEPDVQRGNYIVHFNNSMADLDFIYDESTASGYTYASGWEGEFSNTQNASLKCVTMPLNFEGTTKEQRELYDYAVALTQSYVVAEGDSNAIEYGYDGNVVKSIADNPENAAKIQYYRNIFNEMQKFGYVTEADLHINQAPSAQRANVVPTGVKDNNWFEQGLRQGQLLLKTYDASKGAFVNTTYAEDSNIQEVEDDRRIAKAQVDYDQAQEALERKDKKIDLELKKLDTEHSALQTEYESVKSVVDKNIEKSFNIFS